MRAFVTGATGFIGANLVRALLEESHQVRALVRPASDRANIRNLPVESVDGDVNDDAAKLAGLMSGCDVVFHAAALYSLYHRDRDAVFRVNVDGTRRMLEAAMSARIPRLVYTSSVAAIGIAHNGLPATEETHSQLDHLVGDYKKSKLLAEREAISAVGRGLDVVIVNPSTPVGPYDIKPTPTGEIIVRFLEGRMPFYVNTGLNIVDVRDVARGHLLAWRRGKTGERYILGNRNVTFKEMMELLSQVTGKQGPRFGIPHSVPLIAAYFDEGVVSPLFRRTKGLSIDSVKMSREKMFYDSAKAVRELGLPQSPVEEALKAAVDWFRSRTE